MSYRTEQRLRKLEHRADKIQEQKEAINEQVLIRRVVWAESLSQEQVDALPKGIKRKVERIRQIFTNVRARAQAAKSIESWENKP